MATFNEDVSKFDDDFTQKGPMIPGIPAKVASDRMLLFQGEFDELWRKFAMYSSGEQLFGLTVNDYPKLHNRKRELNLLSKLYSLYLQVMKRIDEYHEIPWHDVDIIQINAEIQEFQNRCRTLPKGMKDWPAFIDLKKKIDDFNDSCPLIEFMISDAVKDRHWEKLETLLATELKVYSPSFTLGHLMEAPLLANKDDVEDICIGAVKEKDIDAKLNQVIADFKTVNIQFGIFKSRGELMIKTGETKEIISLLEDNLMIMNSLASNRFNAYFKKTIMLWVSKLNKTSEILEKWLQVQTLYIYLEAVFVGGDIAKQLPAESKRFANIDKTWVRVMFKARDNPNAVECCTGDDIVSSNLINLLEQLEACQKSLTGNFKTFYELNNKYFLKISLGYLETKRLIFPRFFFMSDTIILEVLGQASDPASVQPHLLSIFMATAALEFDKNNFDVITALVSENKEVVPLEKPVKCVGGVEIWMGTLLKSMQDTMKGIIAQIAISLYDAEFEFVRDFPNFCGQVGLLGCQILWTVRSEFALRTCRKDSSIMRRTNNYFLDLLNNLIEMTVKELTPLERINYETMVTIHVHQRDIFNDLFKDKVRSISDFDWQKQARFYFNDDTDDVVVKITDIDFLYQNEYLGVSERLAITPLTDRCYITLAQAIGMHFGGAPAGPAGKV